MDTHRLVQLLLGTDDLALVVAGLIYAMFGLCLSLAVQALNRDISSPRTPINFSGKFLLSDNVKRLFISIGFIIVSMRFSQELLGLQVTVYISFGIGYGADKLSQMFKKKNDVFIPPTVPSALVDTAIKVQDAPDASNVEVKKETIINAEGTSEKTIITNQN